MTLSAISKNNKVIRLTEERWLHIVESHDEMAGYFEEVLETIENPDFITKGRVDELQATKYYEDVKKHLVVVYKEEVKGGFVITAFFTSKIEKIKRRGIIWQS